MNASGDWLGRAQQLKFQIRNFVNGSWKGQSGGDEIVKHSPRDGRVLCRFGAGQSQDVHDAVGIARCAFEDGRWSRLAVQRRKEVLYRLASLIEQHLEEFALLECLDVGKPISQALNFDVLAASATIRFGAEAADKLYGRVYGADSSSLSYQLHRPLGVVAGIIGWNFPLALAATKVSAALAAGNCLILKPSELTSFTAARLAELASEAGVPEGVFNVIHGDARIGADLAHHHDIDLVTFTGSTCTGKKLMMASARSNMKRLILECGGKAPSLVFKDCPSLEAVADGIVARSFWNQGEVCTASSRLLVQEEIKDELLSIIVGKIDALGLGDPLSPDTRFGALVSQQHKNKVLSFIDGGEGEGARMIYRSKSPAPHESGFYLGPVIFDRVSPDQRIAKEEIFGPVLSVISFRDEEEAIKIANSTVYGLSAILWTKDLGRALRVSHGVKAGWIVANATEQPIGGPGIGVLSVGGHKQSGIGAEGGVEGLEDYMSRTAVQFFA
jgi:acyl-CoA reductase-like NAD-dependent aldehyde dehydrogenase